MFPVTYWTPRYWTGKYWPPTGIVIQLPPKVHLQSILDDPSLLAVISLDDRLGAILTSGGNIAARLDINDAEAAWLASQEPPTATLVQGDLSAVLGADTLAVRVSVLYVSSEILSNLLELKIDDGAIVSVVSSEEQSVTLDA